MTRKSKKVEFHFDERSVATKDEMVSEGRTLVGFNDEQMKILQSHRLELHNSKMALKYLHDENQRVRMALMPLLESEDPAEAIEQLKAKNTALKAALAKSDPLKRIYDEGIPVLVCIHCGGERERFGSEVQHGIDCIWKAAQNAD